MNMEIWPEVMAVREMTEREYADHRESVRKSGKLLVAIDLLDGKIIDGRHRQRACEELGIEPEYRHVTLPEGWTKVQYVRSVNEDRRHLAPSEIACRVVHSVNSKLQKTRSPIEQNQELAAECSAALCKPRGVRDGSRAIIEKELKAASGMVSQRTVIDAMRVQREDPEAFQRIEQGETTVFTEVKKLRDRPKTKRMDDLSRAAAKRVGSLVLGLQTFTDSARLVRFDLLADSGTQQITVQGWMKCLKEFDVEYQKFTKQLRRVKCPN